MSTQLQLTNISHIISSFRIVTNEAVELRMKDAKDVNMNGMVGGGGRWKECEDG